jgi:hypothetical protein
MTGFELKFPSSNKKKANSITIFGWWYNIIRSFNNIGQYYIHHCLRDQNIQDQVGQQKLVLFNNLDIKPKRYRKSSAYGHPNST